MSTNEPLDRLDRILDRMDPLNGATGPQRVEVRRVARPASRPGSPAPRSARPWYVRIGPRGWVLAAAAVVVAAAMGAGVAVRALLMLARLGRVAVVVGLGLLLIATVKKRFSRRR